MVRARGRGYDQGTERETEMKNEGTVLANGKERGRQKKGGKDAGHDYKNRKEGVKKGQLGLLWCDREKAGNGRGNK